MPNYSMEFSEIVPRITPAEREWLETALQQAEEQEDLAVDWSFDDDEAEPGTSSLWLHSDESLPDELLELLRRFLSRWRPTDHLVFSYALTCSRPIPGEFGGGRVLISPTSIVWSDLDAWEREQVALLQGSPATHPSAPPEAAPVSAPWFTPRQVAAAVFELCSSQQTAELREWFCQEGEAFSPATGGILACLEALGLAGRELLPDEQGTASIRLTLPGGQRLRLQVSSESPSQQEDAVL